MDIYIPISNRLGINHIRHELEELAMQAYWPWRYATLNKTLKGHKDTRPELISSINEVIRKRIEQDGLQGDIYGREKGIFSVYQKMLEKDCKLSELADVFAFRILVESVDTCYRMLGAMHNLYRPVPGTFKDYIAIPKANGYQSLHTVLFGPQGVLIELQIRTQDMHTVAEQGIAAHWRYKENSSGSVTSDTAAEWLRNLLEVQKNSGNSIEFLEHVKIDLFPDEVYVFTPRGQIIVLPRGATVIDFAYAVHSDVGNQCVAARVDRQLAPLRTSLDSGQTVEIITKDDARPHPSWLNFVVTGKARATIRTYLKHLESKEASHLGQRLLMRELEGMGTNFDAISTDELDTVLNKLQHHSIDELYQQIGLGNRMAQLVARLLVMPGNNKTEGNSHHSLAIKGSEGMVINYAKCCGPIPGDSIVAIFNPGRGMVVHRQQCPNLGDFRRQGREWLDVEWAEDIQGEFHTTIRVDVNNQRGMLANIAALMAEAESNIEDVRSEERDGLTSCLRFTLMVRNRRHLAAIFRHIRAVPKVLSIIRSIG